MEIALDTIEREFGEQVGMPDRIKNSRCVSGDGFDLMSGNEDLHPLLGKQKQHIQGRVTCSESKLMIGNQAIGEEKGFDVGSDDGFHNLVDDWEKANWSVVAGISFCTFFMQSGMFADFQADGK